ncbi:hypothetical protein NDU88_002066 [Pleurodeles waltl]|uniref:Uncharacterized protein n=1 Tax=Pleurodeles waltl TaxID=8319 RepID=A0AAV7TLI3_PLEWA|nr:hypothetical protein NDU88_002066 [Pleurodeles waltl]
MATARYVTENKGSVKSAVDLWETGKAVLPGQIIARRVGLRMDKEKEFRVLEDKLLQQEAKYVAAPIRDRPHRVEEVRRNYMALVWQEARAQFRATPGRLNEMGNKDGKLLAWLAKNEEGQ